MAQERQKKVRKVKDLFVQDLARIQGGTGPAPQPQPQKCPELTTLACGEERPGCGC